MSWIDPTQEKKGALADIKVPKIDVLVERDHYLRLHEWEIRRRFVSINGHSSLGIKWMIRTSESLPSFFVLLSFKIPTLIAWRCFLE